MTYAMPANDGQTSAWPQPADETTAASDGFASLVLRLRLALRRDPDPRKRQLVEQILTAAAESEQRLAEQADRIAELEQLSGSDDLTGLPNRRAFDAVMARELAAASRDGHGGTLAFLDLDRFKMINDRHGHAAGDAALCHVAQHLRTAPRASDFVARLHGDEFALVLPGATLAQAEPRVSALASRIERLPLRFGDALIPVSISYGLAAYDGKTDQAALLRLSDRAMYRRKRARQAE